MGWPWGHDIEHGIERVAGTRSAQGNTGAVADAADWWGSAVVATGSGGNPVDLPVAAAAGCISPIDLLPVAYSL